MELNSEKNFSITGMRKKTRKALRPDIGESNIGMGATSIARLSLGGAERQKPEESGLSSIFSRRVGDLKREKSKEPVDENKVVALGLNLSSMMLNGRSREAEGRSSILRKSFKEDMVDSTTIGGGALEEQSVERQNELNSSTGCPFLVGSGSEASYERSSEAQGVVERNKYDSRVNSVLAYGDDLVSLKDLVFDMNSESLGMLGASHDVEELSRCFSRIMSRFETFGLNIQGRLEKLEQDLEKNIKELGGYGTSIGEGSKETEDGGGSRNEPMRKSERYLELMQLKSRLLEELSSVENEIMLEEMRIKKEESERRLRIEECKGAREIYRDDLSSLTVIICWIEDCLQKFVYPIQKKQSEFKMDISRESDITRLIQEEITKIEKQERLVLEKLREIQEVKRYKGEEKELLEEQIRLSQTSKSEKIKNANFKEAAMISQTIKVLQQEVSELEENYSSVLHREKEFMEKLERIRKLHQDEVGRMDSCRREILVNRKQRRQQLRLRIEQLKECRFSFRSEGLSETGSLILSSLSEKFSNQVQSVLDFEISLINRQDLDDEKEHDGIGETQAQSGKAGTVEANTWSEDKQSQVPNKLESDPACRERDQESSLPKDDRSGFQQKGAISPSPAMDSVSSDLGTSSGNEDLSGPGRDNQGCLPQAGSQDVSSDFAVARCSSQAQAQAAGESEPSICQTDKLESSDSRSKSEDENSH